MDYEMISSGGSCASLTVSSFHDASRHSSFIKSQPLIASHIAGGNPMTCRTSKILEHMCMARQKSSERSFLGCGERLPTAALPLDAAPRLRASCQHESKH
jgi:hypothetical protein